MPEPRTLEELKAVRDPVARVRAAQLYLGRVDKARRDALAVRDDAVRSLPGGPTSIAQATGLTVHLVKLIRRPR